MASRLTACVVVPTTITGTGTKGIPRTLQCLKRVLPVAVGDTGTDTVALDLATVIAAGFSDISIEPLDAVSSASNPAIPAVAYCQGTHLRNEFEAIDPVGLGGATDHAASAIASHFGADRVEGRIRAIIVTAR